MRLRENREEQWDVIYDENGEPGRQEALAAAIDYALSTLPLPEEKAIREWFCLDPNPMLEDVRAGSVEEAIVRLRITSAEILLPFV